MIHIVTGGSSSGKSVYAENMAVNLAKRNNCTLIYLATLADRGRESLLRIEKHRKQREGKGFITIEKSRDISECDFSVYKGKCVVLLEDMTNLLAGYRYLPGSTKTAEEILGEIVDLSQSAAELIIVVNEITAEIMEDYHQETQDFARELSGIVNRLSDLSASVTEVVLGNAIVHKMDAGNKEIDSVGLHKARGERMFFITGAAYSGKTFFAKSRYPEKLYINSLDELVKYMGTAEELVIDDLQFIIKEQLEKGVDVVGYWSAIIPDLKRRKAVIIGREMGCGMLPMDKNARDYLELYGKTVGMLSAKADEIYRVITGVHQRIR